MITRYEHIDITVNNSIYMIQLQTFYEMTTSGIEPANMRTTMRRGNHEATLTYILY